MIGKEEINKLLGLWTGGLDGDFTSLTYYFLHEGELYRTEISYNNYLKSSLMPLKLQFHGNHIAVYSHVFDMYNDYLYNIRCMCPIKKLKSKRGRRKYLNAMLDLKEQGQPHHYEEMIVDSEWEWCVREIKGILYGVPFGVIPWRRLPTELLYAVNLEYGSKEIIDFYLNPFQGI